VLSIQIVDSRHEPTTLDLQLDEWLATNAKPRVVVATKSDKLSQNELRRMDARARLALSAERVIVYSATTGKGREEVWRTIEEAIKTGARG
jgi:GTP-binding protein